MTYTSRMDLSEHVRKGAAALLQARLADAIDLEAQLKQAHWNVKGRDFFQLHQLFDETHDAVEELVDTIAERITALGEIADGRIQTAASTSTLYEYPLQAVGGEAHLKAVAAAFGQFGKALRASIDAATSLGDLGTADLFTEASRVVDKRLWFVEAHLVGG